MFLVLIKFVFKFGCNLRLQLHLIFFFFNVNFYKSTIRLYFLLISFMLAKFSKHKRSIGMLLINYLNL